MWIYDENGTVEMEIPCTLRGWSHLRQDHLSDFSAAFPHLSAQSTPVNDCEACILYIYICV